MDKHQLLYEWAKRTAEASASENLPYLISSTDVPYEQWMEENSEYLLDLHDVECGFLVVKNAEDFRQFYDPDDSEANLCVTINLYVPKHKLIEEFRQLLKEHHPGKAGRPQYEQLSDFGWCEISGQTTLNTLELMLKVYDLRTTTDLRLWEIAERLKMNPNQTTKTTDRHEDLVDKKSVLSSTASRYLQWARKLMWNLKQGRFPLYRY